MDPDHERRADATRQLTPEGAGPPAKIGVHASTEHSPRAASADAAPSDNIALQAIAQRYEVLGEAGRGGMGIVYQARDRETGEIVAVKVLKPEIARRADVVERFKNELRLARSVTHKHACRIYELMRFGDTVAISMEYVDGHSLRWVMRRFGGVPFRRGLEWVQEICAALGEAHAQGIIHRDLKPENIMIDDEGRAKVMDFGIALSQESSGSELSDRSGTPRYMSPEQAAGEAIDARTDVYALGLIMSEMFTGRSPSQRSDDENTSSPGSHRPRSLEPLVPVFLDKVIRQCLRRDPRKRFASANALAKALEMGELNEFESEITAIPAGLTRGRKLDAALLVLGALGLLAFLWLSPLTIPESRIRVQLTRRMFIQQATDELRRRGWPDPREARLEVSQARRLYHYLLDRRGATEALDRYAESRPFRFDVHFRDPAAGADLGGVFFDHTGQIHNLWLPVEEVVSNGVDVPRDSALAVAAQEIEHTFGVQAGAMRLESEAQLSVKGRRGHEFGWVQADSSGFSRWASAAVYDRATALRQWTDLPESYTPPVDRNYILWWITSCLALVIGLFIAKRIHTLLRRESVLVLLLAGIPLVVVLTILHVKEDWSISLLVGVITTLFFGGYLIMALPTVHYLARRSWPHRTLGLMRLAELRPDPRATGLAIVRGFAAGLAFLGLAEGLRWVAMQRGWATPNPAVDIVSALSGAVPFSLVVEAGARAVIIGLIFALVTGLVSRWTRSVVVLLVVAGLVFVGLTYPEDWFGRGLALFAGIVALWLFSTFDLTTLIAAIFTWGLWLNGSTAWRALERVGNGQMTVALLGWIALLLWALFAAYRPLWAGLRRNLLARFD